MRQMMAHRTSLSILLCFKAENRALRPLRVADRDFRVPRIRDAHRPQRHAHVEEVVSGLNQRIGMVPELADRRSDPETAGAPVTYGLPFSSYIQYPLLLQFGTRLPIGYTLPLP